MDFDGEAKKISLSIKALAADKAREEAEESAEEETTEE